MIQKLKKFVNLKLANKDYSELLKGGAVYFVAKLITVLLALVLNYVIARYYGPSELGVFSIINSFYTVVAILCTMGMSTAILRFVPEHIVKYSPYSAYLIFRKLLVYVVVVSILAAIGSYLMSDQLANVIFKKSHLAEIFAVASLFIVFLAVGRYFHESLRALKNVKGYAMLDVSNALFKVLLLVFLTIFYKNANNSIYTIYVSNVYTFIMGAFLIYYGFRAAKPCEKVYKPKAGEIANIALPMFMTGAMSAVISQTDILMLGMMTSVEAVGVYSVAAKLALLGSFILMSVNSIATPKFSELYHSGKVETLVDLASNASKLVFWLSAPLVLVFIIFGKFFLGIFGDEFVEGYYSLVFLSLGQIFNGASGSVGSFLNMTGHQRVFNYIVIVGGVTNIALNYLLIPTYGIEGAAFSTMTSVLLWNALSTIYIRVKFGFFIGYFPLARMLLTKR